MPSRVRKRIVDPALNEGIIDRVISRAVVASKFKLSVCNDRGSAASCPKDLQRGLSDYLIHMTMYIVAWFERICSCALSLCHSLVASERRSAVTHSEESV